MTVLPWMNLFSIVIPFMAVLIILVQYFFHSCPQGVHKKDKTLKGFGQNVTIKKQRDTVRMNPTTLLCSFYFDHFKISYIFATLGIKYVVLMCNTFGQFAFELSP